MALLLSIDSLLVPVRGGGRQEAVGRRELELLSKTFIFKKGGCNPLVSGQIGYKSLILDQ
jgi:hypothetical protein